MYNVQGLDPEAKVFIPGSIYYPGDPIAALLRLQMEAGGVNSPTFPEMEHVIVPQLVIMRMPQSQNIDMPGSGNLTVSVVSGVYAGDI